jgi:hypothetical protein
VCSAGCDRTAQSHNKEIYCLLCIVLAFSCLQRTWDAKDMSTQVNTPALQKQQGSARSRLGSGCSNLGGKTAEAAAAGEAAGPAVKQLQQQGCQAGGGACDVSASPVKVRHLRCHELCHELLQQHNGCLGLLSNM